MPERRIVLKMHGGKNKRKFLFDGIQDYGIVWQSTRTLIHASGTKSKAENPLIVTKHLNALF